MRLKTFWKYFIFIFLINFSIFNWNKISWIFNYKVISGIIYNFSQKNDAVALSNYSSKEETKLKKFEYSDKENSLEIPKIDVFAPLILVANENEVYKNLNRGVVHFPHSVLPGERGQTIILGHSAPPGWPKINYDWIFTRLNELEKGDIIILHFMHQKLNYYVTDKIFLNKGDEVPEQHLTDLTNYDNILVLISCWPPGKDLKRIAVVAKLKI